MCIRDRFFTDGSPSEETLPVTLITGLLDSHQRLVTCISSVSQTRCNICSYVWMNSTLRCYLAAWNRHSPGATFTHLSLCYYLHCKALYGCLLVRGLSGATWICFQCHWYNECMAVHCGQMCILLKQDNKYTGGILARRAAPYTILAPVFCVQSTYTLCSCSMYFT